MENYNDWAKEILGKFPLRELAKTLRILSIAELAKLRKGLIEMLSVGSFVDNNIISTLDIINLTRKRAGMN